jgi:pimeloyl-ACP methyl ester carboxylesterase
MTRDPARAPIGRPTVQSVHLSSGTIHYRDSGGDAPPVVFVHGALVNGELWSGVVAALGARCRCIVPDWPLGSHPEPLRTGAELTPRGVARLVAEFLEALDLEDVLLVGNDSGGAVCQLVAAAHRARISSLVLTNCDALDVFPPRAYAYLKWLARSPGAMRAMTRLSDPDAHSRRAPAQLARTGGPRRGGAPRRRPVRGRDGPFAHAGRRRAVAGLRRAGALAVGRRRSLLHQ